MSRDPQTLRELQPFMEFCPGFIMTTQRGVEGEKFPPQITQIRFSHGAAGFSTLPSWPGTTSAIPLPWPKSQSSQSSSVHLPRDLGLPPLLVSDVGSSPLLPEHLKNPAQTFCSPNFSFWSFDLLTQQEPGDSGENWNVPLFNTQRTNVIFMTHGCCHLSVESLADFWPPGLAQPGDAQPDTSTATKITACWAAKASQTSTMGFSYNFVRFGPKCVCRRRFVSIFFFANRDFNFLKVAYDIFWLKM